MGFYRFVIVGWLSVLVGCAGGVFPLPVGDGSESTVAGQAFEAGGDAEAGVACLGSDRPASTTHHAMLDALNSYRLENGLAPLVYSKKLEQVIEAHLRDLWARDYFEHVNPDGQGPADRALEHGFCHRFVGENLAAGQPSIERVMQAWRESPPHHQNLVDGRYVYVGMGTFTAPNGRRYWGQLFAFDMP